MKASTASLTPAGHQNMTSLARTCGVSRKAIIRTALALTPEATPELAVQIARNERANARHNEFYPDKIKTTVELPANEHAEARARVGRIQGHLHALQNEGNLEQGISPADVNNSSILEFNLSQMLNDNTTAEQVQNILNNLDKEGAL